MYFEVIFGPQCNYNNYASDTFGSLLDGDCVNSGSGGDINTTSWSFQVFDISSEIPTTSSLEEI